MKKVLLTKIKQGDIILLHDSGETFGADENAPRNKIEVLMDKLKEAKIRHLNCSRFIELL